MTTLASPGQVGRRGSRLGHLRARLIGLDWVLVGSVLAITLLSLYVIDIATAADNAADPNFFLTRQVLYVVLGAIGLVGAALIDPERLQPAIWLIWGGLLGALAIVFVLGSARRGSTRWIELGPLNLQPSELGKVAIIIVVATLVADRGAMLGPHLTTLAAVFVTAVPAAAVFIQPDLGTTLVYMAVLAAILLVAGAPLLHFVVAGALGVTVVVGALWVLPAFGVEVLQDYQVDRLIAFVDSESDPSQNGYQLTQSKIAIGSGGALGKGPDGATQTIYNFLPEHHTDFIFAVVSEMYGFVGAGLLVMLYGLVIWRGLRILGGASSRFDQLLATGVVAMLAFQVFVNIGMNVGIMPITGIPLPLMSYGGSHTITTMTAVGVLLSVHRRRDRSLG